MSKKQIELSSKDWGKGIWYKSSVFSLWILQYIGNRERLRGSSNKWEHWINDGWPIIFLESNSSLILDECEEYEFEIQNPLSIRHGVIWSPVNWAQSQQMLPRILFKLWLILYNKINPFKTIISIFIKSLSNCN